MNKIIVILIFLCITACKTVRIKNENYKVSDNALELGSIGNAKSKLNLENTFEIKSLPLLNNKIRLNLAIVPFTKSTAKTYLSKNKYQQDLNKLNYIDSLSVKPELVTIQIADKLSYINELNGEHNRSLFTLIDDLQNVSVVSSIAVYLSNEVLIKIKQADAYYLVNNQDRKYTIALYNQGKKTEIIETPQNTIIAYQTSNFCWAQTQRGKWYIADFVLKSSDCTGKTFSKVKEKKVEDNLFKI